MARALTFFIVTVFLVSFLGCARTVWYRQDATQQQFAADQKACAGEVGGTKYPSSGFTGAANLDRFYLPCMQERGWTLQQVRSPESHCPLAWPAPCDPAFIDACPSCTK